MKRVLQAVSVLEQKKNWRRRLEEPLWEFAVNNFPPSVTVLDTTVELGKDFGLQGRFSVSDIDPNSVVTKYRFRDSNTSAQSGYFTLDGVKWQQGLVLEINAADLHRVKYRSAALISSEFVTIQAFDGLFWSDPGAATFFSVVPNLDPPVVSGLNINVVALEAVRLSDFVSASDPNGYPILEYLVNDTSADPNGGYFSLFGTRLASATWHSVTPTEFANLFYHGALYGTSETLAFHARDEAAWSPIKFFSAFTSPNNNNPFVTANKLSLKLGTKIDAQQMYSFSDIDGNSMKWVQIKDLGTSPTSGYLELDGVKQAAGAFIRVNFNELGRLKYVAGAVLGSENFQVQVWDGQRLSTISTALAVTTELPTISSTGIRMVGSIEEKRVADFLTINSSVSPLSYEVIDLNDLPSSGSFVLNGFDLEQNKVHTLNPQQFSDLRVRGGPDDLGRSFDRYLIRVDNGFEKSAWTPFEISTDPVNQDGVLGFGEWDYVGPQLKLTYSFPTVVPSYYCPTFPECTDFTAITDLGMRTAIRDVLDIYETFVNVRYTEVGANTPADITFALSDNNPGASAYAYIPGEVGVFSVNGDQWGTTSQLPSLLMSDPGQFGHFVWLHENGHSLGLKHSFDGALILPEPMENDRFTVMSYNSIFTDPVGGGTVYPRTPMLYDVMALQGLYGRNPTYRAGNTHIRLEPNSPIPQTIYDPNGFDTLNLGNHAVGVSIDLVQGQFSSVGGGDRNVAIAWGTVIENARGGSGDDVIRGNELSNLLYGNNGNDRLEGRAGQDYLRGHKGNDTYVWGIGDDYDIINDEFGAGWDVFEVQLFNEYDDDNDTLTNNFSFRRFGNDLRIDLSFDGQDSHGGVRIQDMGFGKNRIETLRIMNTDGEQIGVDINLNSIFGAASLTSSQFVVTTNTSKYGNLAVPLS